MDHRRLRKTMSSSCVHVHDMLLFVLLVVSLAANIGRATAKVPAVIVFGDSSVDAGNNNYIPTIARSNFEPYGRDFAGGRPTGRFSNGRIPTDFISEAFGLKQFVPAYLDPKYNITDFATGVTFASAATGYDNATSDVLSVIPLWKQLEYYKEYQNKLRAYVGEIKANEIINESLHMTSLGTNDFLENYYAFPGRQSGTRRPSTRIFWSELLPVSLSNSMLSELARYPLEACHPWAVCLWKEQQTLLVAMIVCLDTTEWLWSSMPSSGI
ncbi:hypothetical protein L6164_007480 [Bauhinia variegata]|uniref:Uncharacterized protein n=1 Tax=Bauhinia variegata TaxID=167791 RepID=A0ACB9PD90_BAUVA|nr:hypothetical protein L6164_007480 [Bauhinia variegata]